MEVITSRENKVYKALKKLLQRKYRERERAFLAEGPSAANEALRDIPERVRMIAVKESFAGEVPEGSVVLSDKLFDEISGTENTQGIITVIEMPTDDGCGHLGDRPGDGPVIVLDRLQDPGNIGTIIRTAEAAGAGPVMTLPGTCDIYSPKVVRSCAGTILRQKVIRAGSTEEAAGIIKDAGLKIAVADMNGGISVFSREYRDASKNGMAIVIGNEGNGISDEFRDAADIKVRIPMKGKTESLNAGVAAALMMYEANRPEE